MISRVQGLGRRLPFEGVGFGSEHPAAFRLNGQPADKIVETSDREFSKGRVNS